jgi:hypothetical protein
MEKKIFQVRAFINTYHRKNGYTMVWSEEYIYLDIDSAVNSYKTLVSRMKFKGSNYKGASGLCMLKYTEINQESKGEIIFNKELEETKY